MTLSRTKTSASTSYKALFRLLSLALVSVVLASCGLAFRRHEGIKVASWYGPGFNGKRTASGEVYDMYAMTAAHKTFSFGTKLKLTSVENHRSVVVTVNDRGPFVRGRDIDLSRAAAMKLGLIGSGTGRVYMKILGRDMRYAKYLKSGKVPSSGGTYQRAGTYTVQVAAFGEKDSAKYMLNGLKLNHRKAYMTEKWIDGKRFYRVRVGKFRSESSAQAYARKLAGEGYSVRVSPYEM
ncbi:MAG TPA: septal ring lytic transglycosylase RlpA family protein [Nitrospirae bacterium]|nr:septal ring lytic transglycosylase RlpA family protein [Nitrospirota bacterium]